MSSTKSAIQRRTRVLCAIVMAGISASAAAADEPQATANMALGFNPAGLGATLNVSGPVNTSGPFFQSLGSNGRSCATCHVASESMSFTPLHAQILFALTRGADPLFAGVDGANCPEVARRDAGGHSMILRNGLIRIALAVPANAQYSISVVHDPYGCALRTDPKTGVLTASVYRRPLPSSNLSYLTAVMWDTRETVAPLNLAATDAANLRADLAHQAMDAVNGHAEAQSPPTDAQVQSIVNFELGLYSAQVWNLGAGLLSSDGGQGGVQPLAHQIYYPGINDTLGQDPNGIAFTPVAMTVFSAWEHAPTGNPFQRAARAQIAAGEKIFNSAVMTISNVRGLNDSPALNNPTSFTGTCATCHDAPNVGNHSLPLPLDIGTAHTSNPRYETDPVIAAAVSELSVPDLPVFLISGCADPFNAGQTASFYTTDPGKALVSGNCADFNRMKGPVLRGLAGRAPYFHNGAGGSLREVVNFYNQRFQMHLTETQKTELVVFLNSL